MGYSCFDALVRGCKGVPLSRLGQPIRHTRAKAQVDCPGRIWVDLCSWVQAREELANFKLSTVARHCYLGPFEEMTREEVGLRHHARDLAALASYGERKTQLVADLAQRYAVVAEISL